MHPIFSDAFYASTFGRRALRAVELGWRYYFWDLPCYMAHRQRLGLNAFDLQAAVNPIYEFFDRKSGRLPAPDGYRDALAQLHSVGVRLTLPPSRVVALVGCWQSASAAPGDVVECGSYRGATALLIALLGKIQGRRQRVHLFDTFRGSPHASAYDSLRTKREYLLPASHLHVLGEQAIALGVDDRVEAHAGEFHETFESLRGRDLRFSFGHIDANLYESTLDACRFVLPRVAPGGAVVFDDYHGPCDLGARLAIDSYLAERGLRPSRLAGSSACLCL